MKVWESVGNDWVMCDKISVCNNRYEEGWKKNQQDCMGFFFKSRCKLDVVKVIIPRFRKPCVHHWSHRSPTTLNTPHIIRYYYR